MVARYAVYFAPPAAGSLWQRAAIWLGRNAATGETHQNDVAGIPRERLDNFTRSPNRYGFHATLRPPMQLADGVSEADFTAAIADFAATQSPLDLGPMVIRPIEGFLAIVPAEQSQAITGFAQQCIEITEELRKPLSESDRLRRTGSGHLSERQLALLERYGYPYVAEQFRFHMTLTDRLDPADSEEIAAAANTWFSSVLEAPMQLDSVSIFIEPEPGEDFRRDADFALAQEPA